MRRRRRIERPLNSTSCCLPMPLQLDEVLFLTELQNIILLLKLAQHRDMCFQCCLDVLDALPKSVVVLMVAQNAEQHCRELVEFFYRSISLNSVEPSHTQHDGTTPSAL